MSRIRDNLDELSRCSLPRAGPDAVGQIRRELSDIGSLSQRVRQLARARRSGNFAGVAGKTAAEMPTGAPEKEPLPDGVEQGLR
ncbi:MAG: hypothetical protein GF331_14350 [Chitinivibrionales bacterium]|nr:hypothetical protein [Chitinivibrionales bacterium]